MATPLSPVPLEIENPKEQSPPKKINPTKPQNAHHFLKKLKSDTRFNSTSLDQGQKTILGETIHT
jgi:hypothetical protein